MKTTKTETRIYGNIKRRINAAVRMLLQLQQDGKIKCFSVDTQQYTSTISGEIVFAVNAFMHIGNEALHFSIYNTCGEIDKYKEFRKYVIKLNK